MKRGSGGRDHVRAAGKTVGANEEERGGMGLGKGAGAGDHSGANKTLGCAASLSGRDAGHMLQTNKSRHHVIASSGWQDKVRLAQASRVEGGGGGTRRRLGALHSALRYTLRWINSVDQSN